MAGRLTLDQLIGVRVPVPQLFHLIYIPQLDVYLIDPESSLKRLVNRVRPKESERVSELLRRKAIAGSRLPWFSTNSFGSR